MNDWKLPEELRKLERELGALPQPGPPEDLYTTVFRDVLGQLRGDRRRRWYAYAACAAVAAAIWANLSFIAARETDYNLLARAEQQTTAGLEVQLRELLPDLDPREARRYAMTLRLGSGLAFRPGLPARPAPRDRVNDYISQLP